jgi:type IV secretion system protein VirB9
MNVSNKIPAALAPLVVALACQSALADTAKPALPQPPASTPVVVPAISSSVPSSTENAAKEWESLIAAPPQSKMSFKTRKEAEDALTAAFDAGKISSLPPIAGDDGAVLYPYGQSWPTVVCSPLHVCVIQLGKGDKPTQVVLGQPGMWQMTQAMAGDTPLLALAPRFKDLHTNLMISATAANGEPRVYYINLVSDEAKYIPKVGFYYPGDISAAWTAQAQEVAKKQAAVEAAAKRAEDQTVAALPSLTASNLDFSWHIHCDSHSHSWFSRAPDCGPIKPTRVFSDGQHTYIAMPPGLSDTTGLPTLMASNTAGQPAIINYRFKNGYYVVDGVPERINLVAGNGDGSKQRVVTITHGE